MHASISCSCVAERKYRKSDCGGIGINDKQPTIPSHPIPYHAFITKPEPKSKSKVPFIYPKYPNPNPNPKASLENSQPLPPESCNAAYRSCRQSEGICYVMQMQNATISKSRGYNNTKSQEFKHIKVIQTETPYNPMQLSSALPTHPCSEKGGGFVRRERLGRFMCVRLYRKCRGVCEKRGYLMNERCVYTVHQ
jgi:hypothetical protein